MTRREFDRTTKENWGGPGMASDERCGYRNRRKRQHRGSGSDCPTETRDYLADRLAETATMRRQGFLAATLEIGGRWRAPARWAAQSCRTLLTGRI